MTPSQVFKSRWLPSSLIALALFAGTATARAGFEKLQGQYTGTYSSSATSIFQTQTATGPSKAKLKALAMGRRGRLNLTGSNQSVPGSTYAAQIDFKAGGNCSTNAIVPGVVNESATGTWTANTSGKKVIYNLHSSSPFGTYNARGVITGTGENLKVKITFTGTVATPGAPNKGFYIYAGSR